MNMTHWYQKLQLNWQLRYILIGVGVMALIGFSSAVATWQHIHPDRQILISWWGYVSVVVFGYVLWVAIALIADISRVLVPVTKTLGQDATANHWLMFLRRNWLVTHMVFGSMVATLHLMADTAALWWLFSGDFDYLAAVAKKLLRWLPIEIIGWWACVAFFSMMALRQQSSVVADKTKMTQRLCYQQAGETHYLNVEHLVFLESCDNYAIANANAEKRLISESLKSLEQNLDPETFLRIHRRYLVNMRQVIAWQKQASGLQLQLSGGEWLPVSRRKASQVLKFCQNRLSHLAMPS